MKPGTVHPHTADLHRCPRLPPKMPTSCGSQSRQQQFEFAIASSDVFAHPCAYVLDLI
jgi:hypothetical protein